MIYIGININLHSDNSGNDNNTNDHPFKNSPFEGVDFMHGYIDSLQELVGKLKCHISPEDMVIEKDLFENLSEEAQYIISLIFDMPDDLTTIILEKKKQKWPTIATIKKYLKSKGWKYCKYSKALKEISSFLKYL
jgi:hypothetical protein